MRTSVAILALALVLPPGTALAQQRIPPPLTQARIVRVWSDRPPFEGVEGRLDAIVGDTLRLSIGPGAQRAAAMRRVESTAELYLGDATRIDVWMGASRRPGVAKGALTGGAIGLVVGLTASILLVNSMGESDTGMGVVAILPILPAAVAISTLIGVSIGSSTNPDQWRTVVGRR